MMNKIFAGMIVIAVICGVVSGRAGEVGAAAFAGAASGVDLILGLLGSMCLWCGVMKILEASGLSQKLAKLLSPITTFLFPDVPKKSAAMDAISMNITAELMGLSNAATPLGLKAMEELSKLSHNGETATRSMSMLVVINTTALQLIPSTIIAMRMSFHSQNPFEIILPMLCASLCSSLVGVLLLKLCTAGRRGR